jgi:subtilisin
MKRRLICLAVLLVLAGAGLMGQPGPADRVKVLIGFDQQPGVNEQALIRAFGGTVRHTYRLIPAIAAVLPRNALTALSNHPAVSVIEPDVAVFALDEYDNAWGVKKINARTVHDIPNLGAVANPPQSIADYGTVPDIKVCVIDTGIDQNHPDLFGRYAGGHDFVNDDDDPADDNGHGTHVAGTIAAIADSQGVIGVAPETKILAYKILNADGSGSFSDAIAAVDACWAAGGLITSNSYGSSQDPGSLVQAAFDNAAAAGILHVAAAGNARIFTCRAVSYPARYGSVIAVGATDSSDTVASFSCRGPEVELAAPGVNILSTYPDNRYATASGTSMATPHVSGLAALVFGCGLADLNNDAKVNNADVRLRMQQTALDLGTAGRDTSYGFGRIQADLAATTCGPAPPPVTPPTAPVLSLAGVTKNSVSLSWTDSDTETSFTVERCTGATCTDFAVVATLSQDTTSYTNSGLKRLKTYSFRVKAVNSSGSTESNIVVATTTAK